MLISYIIAPQISALRAQKNTLPPEVYLDQAQQIFTNITLLFVLLGSIAFGLTFLWCHEKVVRADTPGDDPADVRDPAPQPPTRHSSARASFFYLIGVFTVAGASVYYATVHSR